MALSSRAAHEATDIASQLTALPQATGVAATGLATGRRTTCAGRAVAGEVSARLSRGVVRLPRRRSAPTTLSVQSRIGRAERRFSQASAVAGSAAVAGETRKRLEAAITRQKVRRGARLG